MNVLALAASAASLCLVVTLASCSGGGSSGGGPMYVETCSLGCTSGQGGQQVSCVIISTYENQEIDVYFSEPVAESSLNTASFNLIDVNSGATPLGTRIVDPNNPFKVIFRPAVTFDSDGNASFGFGEDRTYRLTIPGEAQGDGGPFVTSVGGRVNASRLQCDIRTNLGVVDLVPGAPTVEVFIQTIDPVTQEVLDEETEVLPGTIVANAWEDTRIRFVFNDLMNPVTLANPSTGQFNFVTVTVDIDGDLLTDEESDRIDLPGFATVELDPTNLTTVMTFTPSNGLPPQGSGALPRLIVVEVPTNCQDLVGNQLANPNEFVFSPQAQSFDSITLPDADGENFGNTQNFDTAHSNATVDSASAPGRLTRGFGGGSGRLGDLIVRGGRTVTLNTDSQVFPIDPIDQPDFLDSIRDLIDNKVPDVDCMLPSSTCYLPDAPPSITVTNGIFEFSTLTVEVGGTLRIEGTKHARVFSRGIASVFGTIDVGGDTADQAFRSDTIPGGEGALGGPNGGDGGEGASRNDTTDPELIAAGGENFDETTIPFHIYGLIGGGVGREATVAAGFGGDAFPDPYPSGDQLDMLDQIGALTFTTVDGNCEGHQVGSPGGGGGYATIGMPALSISDFELDNDEHFNAALPAAGGDSEDVGLESPDPPEAHTHRRLDAASGDLRGGAGGGGGGGCLFGTLSSGFLRACTEAGAVIQIPGGFSDHSSCGGGGGGGAIQLVSGHSIVLTGLIDARGGDGGSAFENFTQPRLTRAQPGGGGAGGAVRLQALSLSLPSAAPPRIDLRGGVGGTNSLGARGGDGGAGLVRVEDRSGVDPDDMKPDGPGFSRMDIAAVCEPTPAFFDDDLESKPITSTGIWLPRRQRPEGFTAGSSCWMRAIGNSFALIFDEDAPGSDDPDDKGWNMDVVFDSGSGEELIKYRGDDPLNPFPSGDMQANLGSFVNHDLPAGEGSYFAVRFQGAASFSSLTDLCNVPLTGPGAKIVPGSLTPWVQHPADLNLFSPRPNLVRFCVVFDVSLVMPSSIPSFIKGVTNVRIRATPD